MSHISQQPMSSSNKRAINASLQAKPWRLPYWTEQADFAQQEIEQENQLAESEGADDSEELQMPTAEELENIRRDAYNAGLEQGLVEGRQQGEQQGYQQGLEQGKAEGKRLGEEEGKRVGFASGEAAGKEQARKEQQQLAQRVNAVISHLQGHLLQREQELPMVLAQLVNAICQQVVGHELSQGAQAIEQFVEQALKQLPGDDGPVKLSLNPQDFELFDSAVFNDEFNSRGNNVLQARVDRKLQPGQCRLETQYTLVEYSSEEKLKQLLADAEQQLMRASKEFPDAAEQQLYQQPLAVSEDMIAAEPEAAVEALVENNSEEILDSSIDQATDFSVDNQAENNNAAPEMDAEL